MRPATRRRLRAWRPPPAAVAGNNKTACVAPSVRVGPKRGARREGDYTSLSGKRRASKKLHSGFVAKAPISGQNEILAVILLISNVIYSFDF